MKPNIPAFFIFFSEVKCFSSSLALVGLSYMRKEASMLQLATKTEGGTMFPHLNMARIWHHTCTHLVSSRRLICVADVFFHNLCHNLRLWAGWLLGSSLLQAVIYSNLRQTCPWDVAMYSLSKPLHMHSDHCGSLGGYPNHYNRLCSGIIIWTISSQQHWLHNNIASWGWRTMAASSTTTALVLVLQILLAGANTNKPD